MFYFIISLIISFIITLIMLMLYFIFAKNPGKNVKENSTDLPESYKEAMKLISDARGTALSIVKEANIKALQTLENSSIFNKELRKEMEESIKKLSDKHLASLDDLSTELEETYKKAIESEKTQNVETLHTISEDVKGELLEEVAQFKDTLHKETIESQKLVEDQIKKEYEGVSQELDGYKKDQLSEIDTYIYSVVNETTRRIIGRALDIDTHQDIVIDCLEEAKKQGVFTA